MGTSSLCRNPLGSWRHEADFLSVPHWRWRLKALFLKWDIKNTSCYTISSYILQKRPWGANRSETVGCITQKHIWPRQGYDRYVLDTRCSLQVCFIVWLRLGVYLYKEQIRLYEFNMDPCLKSPSGGSGPKCFPQLHNNECSLSCQDNRTLWCKIVLPLHPYVQYMKKSEVWPLYKGATMFSFAMTHTHISCTSHHPQHSQEMQLQEWNRKQMFHQIVCVIVVWRGHILGKAVEFFSFFFFLFHFQDKHEN